MITASFIEELHILRNLWYLL